MYNIYPKYVKQVLTRYEIKIFLQLNQRSPDKFNFQRVSNL